MTKVTSSLAHHGCILIVEDEEPIRLLAALALSDAGFSVLEAGCADKAIDILEVKHHIVRLLFTDIHMPGSLNGVDLAHHASRNWPWVGILIASAFPASAVGDAPVGVRHRTKPYELDLMVSHAGEMIGVGSGFVSLSVRDCRPWFCNVSVRATPD